MSLESLKWENVKWTDVNTTNDKTIDEEEVKEAKRKGIKIWVGMDEATFNHEKLLYHYIGKCAIGCFSGERSHKFEDLETELIAYGKELESLEEYSFNYSGEVAESTLAYAKPKNTQFIDKQNDKIKNRIQELKKHIVAHASRIFGGYSMTYRNT